MTGLMYSQFCELMHRHVSLPGAGIMGSDSFHSPTDISPGMVHRMMAEVPLSQAGTHDAGESLWGHDQDYPPVVVFCSPGMSRTISPSDTPGMSRTVRPTDIPGMSRTIRPSDTPGMSRTIHYNPSTDPINRLARHEQTTIFRLRTGHCGLRAHLKRIGIMDSALCDCKEAEQTVHHILQNCPIWRKQRHQLWPQGEPTTNKLWGTAEDLRRTTQFLTTCGLRV